MFRDLTLRRRILVFQLLVGLAVAAMFGAGLLTARIFHHHLERQALAHRQLETVIGLARQSRRYADAAAAFLMTGSPPRLDLAARQEGMEAGFAALAAATEAEARFLAERGGVDDAAAERARIERMRTLFADMNARLTALSAMQEAGQSESAVQAFFRDIGRGLDGEVERILDAAIADEMQEVEAADRDAKQAAGRLALMLGVTALILLGITLAAGWLLYRSIVRPVARLSAGALAIGGGDVAHRVGPLGGDELGELGRRFDAMAAQLEAQQRLLRAAQSDLEAQVSARTGELEVANRRLTELDRSRLRFLADVGHELRTPLTVLRGEAEVTLRARQPDPAAARAALARIVEQAGDMARLIDDLMLLARAETGDVRFERELLDLGALAAEAARGAALLGRARGIAVRTTLGAVPPVEGDGQRTKQVLMIVLDNAVKYARRGSIVELAIAAAGEDAVVTVRNRSDHLDQIELPRVFERFYRGPEAAGGGAGGSGLGLAIARWLVEKQGGSIGLFRDGPDGVRVEIRFPALAGLGLAERVVA
jgi:two-component system OmpR family sensor kinase